MYWQFNNSSPHIDAVLQKEGVTLQELMDENDLIQECKMQNKKLVEFLCQRTVLEELITLITEEPSEELDERCRFKYPNIACELLTCDVPVLNETLSQDNALLEKLYSFIDREPPLNPLLASFLSRTLSVLIVKRLDQWISYQVTCLQAMGFLKDKKDFISLLLRHLGTSAIMDLTLKLITEVGDEEHRQNLLNWLDSQSLVQSLVDLFDPRVDSDRHHNASQLLCDVLRISREVIGGRKDRADTDPILTRIESPETISNLLDHMLGSTRRESSIVGGIQVLLALLGHKNNFNDPTLYNNAYEDIDVERKQRVAHSTALVIMRRLKDFHQILLDPPTKNPVRTTIGDLDPPLGNTRLQITRLLAAVIGINNSDILQEIINLGLVEVLLDMFFKYVWNNFLHAQVEQCIAAALIAYVKPADGGDGNAMYPYLVMKCRLLGRILEAWDDNELKQNTPRGLRQGYMGHLITIANLVVKQCLENSMFDAYIKENLGNDSLETWNNFVNGPLAYANRLQNIVLGGIHPSTMSNDDSNEDCTIPSYPNSNLLMQQYNNFEVLKNHLENFGFCDGDLDTEETGSSTERRDKMEVNVSGQLDQQAEMFSKICSECVNTLDDSDDNIFFESRNGKDIDNNWNPVKTDMDTSTAKKKRGWLPNSDEIVEFDPWANVELVDTHNITTGWADFETIKEEKIMFLEKNLMTFISDMNKHVIKVEGLGDDDVEMKTEEERKEGTAVPSEPKNTDVAEVSKKEERTDGEEVCEKTVELAQSSTAEISTASSSASSSTAATCTAVASAVETSEPTTVISEPTTSTTTATTTLTEPSSEASSSSSCEQQQEDV